MVKVESNEKIGYYFMKLQYSVMISNKYNFIGDSNGEFLHCLITLFKGMMYNENEVHIKNLIRKGESKG